MKILTDADTHFVDRDAVQDILNGPSFHPRVRLYEVDACYDKR